MFDLSSILYSIPPNQMLLGLSFIIFFVLLNFLISKTLKGNRSSSTIIALCISLLAVYGLYRINFDLVAMLSSIGLRGDFIYTILPIILAAGLIFVFWKVGFGRTLLIVGLLLIIASFFIYDNKTLLLIGIALFFIGLFLISKRKKPLNPNAPSRESELISAATRFRKACLTQKNPKFANSWAKFVNYLGGSEKSICQRYNVSHDRFLEIFKDYGLIP